MEGTAAHARARTTGINPVVYWIVRSIVHPVFLLYWRMTCAGREHIPRSGPVIVAANHRSFIDPFMIGCVMGRPLYYVAKQELFRHRAVGWLLSALGAFPVRRGQGDADAIATARELLERGEAVLIFPEGTRVRPGGLGMPRRGVGRLALLTGAPVVPVAIAGTEDIRRGWRIRPRKVRIRAGRPLTYPRLERPSPQLAAAVTDRIWPCVMLQWEWLGGMPPLRRAAVVGEGEHAVAAAATLTRAGLEVDRSPTRFTRHDLVCFAAPPGELAGLVARHRPAVPKRAGLLVLGEAEVDGGRRAASVATLAEPGFDPDETLLLQAADRVFARVVCDVLRAGGLRAEVAPAPRPTVATVLRLPALPASLRRAA
jgi:1-acyl-sn-glycerol-3-phosphate acyltransferase